MTKSTRDVSTCFVFKSSPEAFISPLFSKNPPPRSGAMLPHIIWLALGFLPSYAPGYNDSTTMVLAFYIYRNGENSKVLGMKDSKG